MLKIRRNEQAPKFIRATYCNRRSEQSQKSDNSVLKKSVDKKIAYYARFVKENFGDRFKVAPGEEFVKTWTFRNTGETDWPLDSIFTQTNGDEMQAIPFTISGQVKPDQEIDVSLTLKSPLLPGKYCAFFRFIYGDNQRFGQKVWCDILVEQKPEQELMAKDNIALKAEPVELLDASASEQRVSSLIFSQNDGQDLSQ